MNEYLLALHEDPALWAAKSPEDMQAIIQAYNDYMHWYGWGPMKSSFQRIREMAAEYRERYGK